MRPIFLLALIAPVAALSQTVTYDESRCRLLERHQPAADVAYLPGFDVNGNAVVPADLNAPAVQPPRLIPIRLLIPLSQFNNTAPPFLDQAEVDAGTVTVDRESGAIHYNGQPLNTSYVVVCDEDAPPPLPAARPD